MTAEKKPKALRISQPSTLASRAAYNAAHPRVKTTLAGDPRAERGWVVRYSRFQEADGTIVDPRPIEEGTA
jgi:hypothetical protein